MTEQKYTLDGLPVVSFGTLASLQGVIRGFKDSAEITQDFLKRLRNENPDLHRMILTGMQLALLRENEYYSEGYLHGLLNGFIVYESLRRQSAANKLEKELESK